MSDESAIPEYARPRTDEERARVAAMEEKAAALGPLPDGVKIEFGLMDAQAMAAQIAEQDAAVFVSAKSFGWYQADEDGWTLPSVEIAGLEWIEEYGRSGMLSCEGFGIGKEIEGVEVPMFAHFRLNVAPLFIWIDEAPEEWLQDALYQSRRFCVLWPPGEDGLRYYIASGPMELHPEMVRMPGRSSKPGRNDPCPCLSGKKYKHCHGA